jgi:hypothetical protein
MKAAKTYPELRSYILHNTLGVASSILSLARELSIRNLGAEMSNLAPTFGEVGFCTERCETHLRFWRKWCSRVLFSAACREGLAQPLAGVDAAKTLREHWAPAFEAKPTDVAMEERLPHFTPDNRMYEFRPP